MLQLIASKRLTENYETLPDDNVGKILLRKHQIPLKLASVYLKSVIDV